MAQIENVNELPPGYRSNFAYALHADDPDAFTENLDACSEIKRSVLLTDEGGKVPDDEFEQCTPWSYNQTVQSLVRRIDNALYNFLCAEADHADEKVNLHSMVFAIAAKFGSARIVSLLLCDKYRNDVDPATQNNQAILRASENGHVEVVQLLLNDSRVDPSDNRNIAICMACKHGHANVVKLLLCDERVNPSDNKNELIQNACRSGRVNIVKLLLSDSRVDPSANNNTALRMASCYKWNERVEIMQLLLKDKRVDPSENPSILNDELCGTNVDVLRLLLADERIIITNESLVIVDFFYSRVDALFEAAHPRVWPRVIGNNLACMSRADGQLRYKLDDLEIQSSWMLLLCVKHICTPIVAARIGDVLHDVCSEWTRYQSKEVKPSIRDINRYS